MSRSTLDLWVGVFVVIGIGALMFLSLGLGNMGGDKFASTYDVVAEFDDIGGLRVRAPIKSSGVVVGRVIGISLDANIYRARVTFALDSRFHFPADTSASILTSGLLGEQYIGLDPGGDEKMLEAGDRIAITQSAVVLEKLIGQFLFSKASEPPAAN